MSIAPALYAGQVMHRRLHPVSHRLRYRIYSLLVDLDALPDLHRRSRWLSVNRFNLFSFVERDHGDGRATGLAAWVREQLRAAGLPADGRLWMLSMPRVLGHGFNPISLVFCHDAAGRLRAILHEVHNTFGQRHAYLIEVDPAQAGARTLRQGAAKDFHVSPFMDMALRYDFRVRPPAPGDDGFALHIGVRDGERPLLVAQHTARRREIGDAELLRLFVTHPLLTLKVVAAIHWEALRLWLKGVPVRTLPAGVPVPVTVLRTRS